MLEGTRLRLSGYTKVATVYVAPVTGEEVILDLMRKQVPHSVELIDTLDGIENVVTIAAWVDNLMQVQIWAPKFTVRLKKKELREIRSRVDGTIAQEPMP